VANNWTIVRSQAAKTDLYAIWSYLARHDTDAADRWLERTDAALLRLADFPELGSIRPELPPDVRAYSQPPHIIVYHCRPDTRKLVMARILDARRDFPSLFA